jgi:antitoxin (DNA-binding transcriptional repressor) of toxin-antitoxin stability system
LFEAALSRGSSDASVSRDPSEAALSLGSSEYVITERMNLTDAKARLSRYIGRAPGHDFVIGRAGYPLVRLLAVPGTHLPRPGQSFGPSPRDTAVDPRPGLRNPDTFAR